jgi:uncharacterized membrane protein YqjE
MLQKLSYPVGTKMIYSDLRLVLFCFTLITISLFVIIFNNDKGLYLCNSMITAMYVIGKLAQQLGYVHPEELLPACAAPLQPNNPAY